MSDRYLKIVLTLIAVELFWIGLHMGASPVAAQQAGSPMPVIIRGVESAPGQRGTLPVIIEDNVRPVRVEIPQPMRVDAIRPVKIEADQPIRVEVEAQPVRVMSVPYTPSQRPGE